MELWAACEHELFSRTSPLRFSSVALADSQDQAHVAVLLLRFAWLVDESLPALPYLPRISPESKEPFHAIPARPLSLAPSLHELAKGRGANAVFVARRITGLGHGDNVVYGLHTEWMTPATARASMAAFGRQRPMAITSHTHGERSVEDLLGGGTLVGSPAPGTFVLVGQTLGEIGAFKWAMAPVPHGEDFALVFFLTLDGARMRGEDAAPPAPPPRILQELTPAQGEHLVQVIEDAMDLDEPALPYYPPPSPDLGTRPPRKRPREEEGSEGEEEEPDHLLIDLVSSSPPATPPEPPPKRARPVERIDDYLDRVFPKPWFANVRTPSTPHGDEKHRPVW